MATGSTRRIVLIDDDEASRTELGFLLVREGFDVRAVEACREGIAIARSFFPDLILLDLVLPDMNGFEAAGVLKRDLATSSIPLIAVTASWLGSSDDRLRTIGFAGALRKPVPPAALLSEMRKHLGN